MAPENSVMKRRISQTLPDTVALAFFGVVERCDDFLRDVALGFQMQARRTSQMAVEFGYGVLLTACRRR